MQLILARTKYVTTFIHGILDLKDGTLYCAKFALDSDSPHENEESIKVPTRPSDSTIKSQWNYKEDLKSKSCKLRTALSTIFSLIEILGGLGRIITQ